MAFADRALRTDASIRRPRTLTRAMIERFDASADPTGDVGW